MPRSLLDKNKRNKFAKLVILINGAARFSGKTQNELGAVLGRERRTVGKYLRNPQELSVEDLLKLGRNLDIPIEDLRQTLTY